MKKYIISIAKTILLAFGCIGATRKNKYMVYYHDIHFSHPYTDMSTPLSVFEKHLKIIRSLGYNIVKEFSDDKNNLGKEIRIAFDDGFKGIYDNRDYFIKNNIYATIYIPTSLIGKDNYLNEEEIKELENLGFNIQSHGVRHEDMSNMTEFILEDDLLQSKLTLEKILLKKIDEVCFPMGYFSDLVLTKAKKCGYNTFYSSMPNPKNFTKNLMGRLFFQQFNTIQVFLALNGGMRIFQKRYQKLHYKN